MLGGEMRTQRGNVILYSLDIFCTFTAIALILFGLYITPYLFGAHFYDVPSFVVHLSAFLETNQNLQGYYAVFAIIAPIFISAVALLIIAKYVAVYVETHEAEPGVPHVDAEEYQEHVKTDYDSKKHYAKPIATTVTLMVLVLVALGLAEYYLIFSITR